MVPENRIQKIIVVGGGTSGWMSAALLHRSLNSNCRIVLIESPKVPRIGVGEATLPSIKEQVFDFLGIPEEEWMPRCQATYKMAIKFKDWTFAPGTVAPGRAAPDSFYHIFGEVEEIGNLPLTHYWLRKRLNGFEEPLASSAYVASALCDAERSVGFPEEENIVHTAYHFDAQLVADFLRDWSLEHGVEHVSATIEEVRRDERGWISSLRTDDGREHTADLYVDCTGFRSLLLGETLEEPFISFSENLMTDRAVTRNLPFDDTAKSLPPYTTATALSAGWAWRIPLASRVGNGYVYSSAFLEPEEAEREFLTYLGLAPDSGGVRHIRMRVGRTERAWVHNCVGIGLANSFIEPLESTAIYFVYAALHQLIRYFPDKGMDPRLRDKFNERVAFMVDDVRDFIVMHYHTTSRQDTDFWKTNQFDIPISEALEETLALYKAGVPIKLSYSGNGLYKQFDASFDRFWTNSNYLAILAGMNVIPDREAPLIAYMGDAVEQAERRFSELKAEGRNLCAKLPSHYEHIMRQRASHEEKYAVLS